MRRFKKSLILALFAALLSALWAAPAFAGLPTSTTVVAPATAGPTPRDGSTGFVQSITLLTGQQVVVTAVDGDPPARTNNFTPAFGPNGRPGSTTCTNNITPCPAPNLTEAALIARVGGGAWQFVGTGPTTLTGPGLVEFAFNDGTYSDNFGSWNVTLSYELPYPVCKLYDDTKAVKSGATIPIKLQLCDGDGGNVSSATLTVQSTGLQRVSGNNDAEVEDSGNANPDDNFRYDAALGGSGGYIFNLSTKGLASGTWQLSFKVAGEPFTYSVQFIVK